MDESRYKLILDHYPTIGDMNFIRASLNRSITRAYGPMVGMFDSSNNTGMFRRVHSGICPVTNTWRNFTCYYVNNPCNVIERPRIGVEFCQSINTSTRTLRKIESRKRQRAIDHVAIYVDNMDDMQ